MKEAITMQADVQVMQETAQPIKSVFRTLRSWLLGFLIVGLVASNIASVLSASFHSALFDAVAVPLRALLPNHASKLLSRSPTRVAQRAVDGMKSRAARVSRSLAVSKARARGMKTALTKALIREEGLGHALAVTKLHLVTSTERLAASQGALTKHRKAFSTLRGRAVTRMLKSKAVNMVSLPARTVPFAGIALTLGVAAYEIKTDCDMLDELDTPGEEMGEPAGADRAKVCGLSVPDVLTYYGAKKEAEAAIAKLAIKPWWSNESKKQDQEFDLDKSWKRFWRSTCGLRKSWYECSSD
jgi:hypothetical protein